jgi:hypothetical protein
MARRVRQPPAASGRDDDYRLARLWRSMAMRLAVPASDDAAFIERCGEALRVARREAERASGWPGRVEALMSEFVRVYGEDSARVVVGMVEAEPLHGDEARRADYVRAEERAFTGRGQ